MKNRNQLPSWSLVRIFPRTIGTFLKYEPTNRGTFIACFDSTCVIADTWSMGHCSFNKMEISLSEKAQLDEILNLYSKLVKLRPELYRSRTWYKGIFTKCNLYFYKKTILKKNTEELSKLGYLPLSFEQ